MPNSRLNITDEPLPSDNSMFGKVIKLEDSDKEQNELLDNHTLLLQQHAQEIESIKNNYIRIENLVMNENRETRNTITNTNQQLHNLIENLLGYKTGETQMANTLKLAKYESYAKIAGWLIGSGGIVMYILDKI